MDDDVTGPKQYKAPGAPEGASAPEAPGASEGARPQEDGENAGDPETQAVLPRLKTDLVPLMLSCCEGKLGGMSLEIEPKHAISVVAASGGYPGSYEKGKEITGLASIEGHEDLTVFHAGTAEESGKVVTSGGRVLALTALGDSIGAARDRAYEALSGVSFEGMYFRKDIGHRALARE